MQVKLQQSGYRIIDDAPLSIQMSGYGLYSIERYRENWDAWEQVYPESGSCDINYQRVLDKFREFTK